jgi:hypothetical protein
MGIKRGVPSRTPNARPPKDSGQHTQMHVYLHEDCFISVSYHGRFLQTHGMYMQIKFQIMKGLESLMNFNPILFNRRNHIVDSNTDVV